MKKQVLVSVDRGETRVALLEKTNGRARSYRVAELYLERRGDRSIVGNIYKGKVDNVLPGLEAAFVDIGLDKNGFLHVDEIVLPGRRDAAARPRQGGRQEDHRPPQARPGDRRAGRQGPAEDEGRAPVDGADDRRALHGLRAHRRGHRRLQAPRRQGARAPAQGGQGRSTCGGGGAIIRTAAQGAKRADFERELQYLFKLHEVLAQARRGGRRARRWSSRRPTSRSASCATSSRADFERALVDDEKQHHRLVSFFTRTAPELVDRVELYEDEGRRCSRSYGVEEVIDGLMGAPRRPAQRRLPDDRLRRGADGHRRQLRLVRRPRQAGPAGGHDPQDEPRGGRGGRQRAAPARHRRDHRHRLHRHGPRAQPRRGAQDAAQVARGGPHEDVHRRDLQARPRRDDAPERHRGRARDHVPARARRATARA